MNETYLVHNGNRIELTDEQKKLLGVEEKKSPFARGEKCETYYYVNLFGKLERTADYYGKREELAFASANYCTDRELMKQRAMHEALNRLLWRFSCENGELDNPWDDGLHKHWEIYFDTAARKIRTTAVMCFKYYGSVYFPSEEIAQRAINEIVKPFMKAHPEFEW